MPRNITPPTADDVRAWGRNKGFTVADRGRLSHELIAAFNKGRKHTFVQTHAPVPHELTVVGKKATKAGRNVKRVETVTAAPVRAWARANGVDLGQRGRIPQSVLDAYAMRDAAPKVEKSAPVSLAKSRKAKVTVNA